MGIMSHELYFDNSMTTRPSQAAVRAMMPYLSDRWGLPSAPHRRGHALLAPIEKSVSAICRLVGAGDDDTFVFTSSGAEAVCQVINSCYEAITLLNGKNHYLACVNDEAPAIMAIGRLEALNGSGKMVGINANGVVTAAALGDALTPRTALLSLSWANGLLGVIHPVDALSALCRERGVALHLDATHLLGKVDFNLAAVAPDYLTFNGDQLHSPAGSGGLIIRRGASCTPLIAGGLEQAGMRAGSYSIAHLVALGVAANELAESRDYICSEVARLRDKLEQGIVAGFPEAHIFFRMQERLPHISVIAFPGIANEALLYLLSKEGVAASIGGGSFQQISLQLTNCGVDATLANSAISFALSRETTESDVDQAIARITEAAGRLRPLSRAWVV